MNCWEIFSDKSLIATLGGRKILDHQYLCDAVHDNGGDQLWVKRVALPRKQLLSLSLEDSAIHCDL